MTVKVFRKLYGGLSAERHHRAYRFFRIYYMHYVFRSQRLKIKPVRSVVVGGYRFGIIVDYDHVITHLLEGVDAVHGGVVKLNALTDADRTRTEHKHRRLARTPESTGFALRVER